MILDEISSLLLPDWEHRKTILNFESWLMLKRREATMKLEVSEIFGPTLQGEGPSIGKPATFIRLRRCNLQCTWCDTKYTWDKNDPGYSFFASMNYHEIAGLALLKHGGVSTRLIVITGGEPLIWRTQLIELVRVHFTDEVATPQYRIEIETNGTIHPRTLADLSNVFFNVSPKLSSSGNDDLKTIRDEPMKFFSDMAMMNKAIFKFVLSDLRSDGVEIIDIVQKYKIPSHSVYLMPQGTTVKEIVEGSQAVFALAISKGWNATTRLHTLAYGNRRGI
ncbi:hypothetical protein LCGC14_2447870 [marine sediment metagenome]|uniref:Radical SAM core domain-containing protein n=1 Tax=marine sediment metagenome TaxID=412755 RepID=A0A0F9DU61_9ZZZZ